MTTNNNMKNLKTCIQLDPNRKIRIKLDVNANILFVNNYFSEITKFKVSEIILKDFTSILDEEMPKIAAKVILDGLNKNKKSYQILKIKAKDSECFWSLVRGTQEFDNESYLKGFLLEGKMLPSTAIERINKLHEVINEIEKNVGDKAAEKYLNGYLEEKNVSFNELILKMCEIDDKKADKYFEIDEDKVVKKKKGWF